MGKMWNDKLLNIPEIKSKLLKECEYKKRPPPKAGPIIPFLIIF
jgi:hypothetical protein